MTPSRGSPLNRIAVALDPVARNLEALDQAAEMAARLQGHLIALLVEDTSLFELAQLPFAREVDRASGSARPLESGAVARALQTHAERVRRALEATAQSRQISTEFRIIRGHYLAAALEAAAGADCIFLSDATAVCFSPHRSPPPARGRRCKSLWVYCDGSAAAARALTMAASLCRERGAGLSVLLPATAEPRAERTRLAALAGPGIAIDCYSLPAPELATALNCAMRDDCALLFVPRSAGDGGGEAARFLKGLRCPLVLVS